MVYDTANYIYAVPQKLLPKLNLAVNKFLSYLPREQTYSTIVEEAIRLADAQDGLLALDRKGKFDIVYSSSLSLGMPVLQYKDLAKQALRQNMTATCSMQNPLASEEELHSLAYIPLVYQNIPVGVLVTRTKNADFDRYDLLMLELFGSVATLALRKTELYSISARANEIRDLFLSATIHELRTPLTTINGYIHLLQKKITDETAPEFNWIEQLKTQSNKLTGLINDLMEMNQIRTGKLQYIWGESSLHEIIGKAISDVRKFYPKREIVLNFPADSSPDRLVCDYNKLYQAIAGLIDNALKFSEPDTKVVITLRSNSQTLKLTIKDKGIGISEQDQAHLFEEFFKGKQSRADDLGLGLYLSNNIIHEHRGTIEIRSKQNSGTTVIVKLPAL